MTGSLKDTERSHKQAEDMNKQKPPAVVQSSGIWDPQRQRQRSRERTFRIEEFYLVVERRR